MVYLLSAPFPRNIFSYLLSHLVLELRLGETCLQRAADQEASSVLLSYTLPFSLEIRYHHLSFYITRVGK